MKPRVLRRIAWMGSLVCAAAAFGGAASTHADDPPAPSPASTAPPLSDSDCSRPLGEVTPIEDPSGCALLAFHAALRRAQAGAGQARIVFYGASHVASDLYTGLLRQKLQHRFGEAGTGFVLPAPPWSFYRNAGVKLERARGFQTVRIKERAPESDAYGLAGAALEARRGRAAFGAFTTRGNGGLLGYASKLELFYMKRPGGGHLDLRVDEQRAHRIATVGNKREPGYASFELDDGPHRIEVRSVGDGAVRIFGVALERDRPGVILDTLGVPGTRARDQLYFDEPFYREHIVKRRPDLLVLAYGTNESGDDDAPPEQYENELKRMLVRIRAITPDASCLLIGPSDRPVRNDGGSFEPRPLTEQVIDVQRRIAHEHGCGFFDVQRFMGGPMSMLRWVAAEPPFGARDYVHFTQAGYERLGNVLYDALLAGYEDMASPPAPHPPQQISAAHELPRAAK